MCLKLLLFLFFISICGHSESFANENHFQIEELQDDYQSQILNYILEIFCNVQTMFLNICLGKNISTAIFNQIITPLSQCSCAGITLSG